MLDGDRHQWTAECRRRDATFLRFVMKVWWQAVALLPGDPLEDAITKAVVDRLDADAEARALFYCDYQFVPIEWRCDGSLTRNRFIDIAVIVPNDRRSNYLAYECKKLNVRHKGKRRSQAGTYVGQPAASEAQSSRSPDGMMRFVTGKYAAGLPVACMIGYVMDGDLSFAYARIKAMIEQNRSVLRLQDGPTDEPPLDAMTRFVTTHERNGDGIELRHALLPFVQAGS